MSILMIGAAFVITFGAVWWIAFSVGYNQGRDDLQKQNQEAQKEC